MGGFAPAQGLKETKQQDSPISVLLSLFILEFTLPHFGGKNPKKGLHFAQLCAILHMLE